MKKYTDSSKTISNSSKLHRYILDLLISEESLFKHFEIKQECKVSEINIDFKSNRERFDIVIFSPILVVIECHGKQHFYPTTFGGITKSEAEKRLRKQKEQDWQKEEAAREAGWGYVSVLWSEPNLSLKELTSRILEACISSKKDQTIKDKQLIRKIKNKSFLKQKSRLQSGGFQKKPEGYKYKWQKKKINPQN